MLKICARFSLASGARNWPDEREALERPGREARWSRWLRLPSEEEAIKIYQETYDKSFEEQRTNRQ